MTVTITNMTAADWYEVREIYSQGIATGQATFEKEKPNWEQWDENHLRNCRLVAKNEENQIVGWAALSPVSCRDVYRGVAEVSIYIRETMRGEGIGKLLLQALIYESGREGIWTLQAGIFPENKASIALHRSLGFREVGYRERIGQMNDVWRNVILFERRSLVVGI